MSPPLVMNRHVWRLVFYGSTPYYCCAELRRELAVLRMSRTSCGSCFSQWSVRRLCGDVILRRMPKGMAIARVGGYGMVRR